MNKHRVKRVFDLVAGSALLISLAIPMGVVAIFVRVKLGSPIFFRQERPGLEGRPFVIIKFRTMTDEVDSSGRLLDAGRRLTTFGRLLRSTSLDELPELWNVIKGDMSLVGPRPLLMSYLPLYNSSQRRRHDMRPGITGWAQVNGRNLLTWDEKFALDTWYIDNFGMWLDLKILLLTALKVFKRDGVNASADVTMLPFTGAEESPRK